ncbi:MAG: thioredoxin family protein [Candidatus Micrarchaeota archaeon]
MKIFYLFAALVLALFVLGCTGEAPQDSGDTGTFVLGNDSINATPVTSDLIEFYGAECPHCANMEPIVSQVESEAGVEFSKLEVWHNIANANVFQKYAGAIKPACGGILGVPAFYNVKTGKAVCGEMPKEKLLAFVKSG